MIDGCGLSRYEIAKRCGVSESVLSRFMRRERGITLDTLDRIAALLGHTILPDSAWAVLFALAVAPGTVSSLAALLGDRDAVDRGIRELEVRQLVHRRRGRLALTVAGKHLAKLPDEVPAGSKGTGAEPDEEGEIP